jgi:hypothetical protein
MITRRTVLKVEELGARVLPSATAIPTAAAATAQITQTALTAAAVTKVNSPSWVGHGRYTTTRASTGVVTYQLQGSADFGRQGFFAIKGTLQTVGNRSGQAKGRITLSNRRGTLTIDLLGPTQSAGSRLPSTLNYRIVSGTGFFARYGGTGTIQLSTMLFFGYSDKGHFDMILRPKK